MKIKKIIAREGLILLGISVALYFILALLPDISFSFPKYKLELEDGKTYTVTIVPELSQHYNIRKSIESALNPPPELISKRINEFIKDNNLKSALKSSYLVNYREVYFSKLIHSFFAVNFIFKLAAFYLFFSIIRFIIWALKTLKE